MRCTCSKHNKVFNDNKPVVTNYTVNIDLTFLHEIDHFCHLPTRSFEGNLRVYDAVIKLVAETGINMKEA